jgi:hypothetical protein
LGLCGFERFDISKQPNQTVRMMTHIMAPIQVSVITRKSQNDEHPVIESDGSWRTHAMPVR